MQLRGSLVVVLGSLVACTDDPTPPPAPLVPQPTIDKTLRDPLAGTGVESCPVYQEQRCVAGRAQRCAIIDVATRAEVAAPDATLERAFLYDRWYDRYTSPLGLTAERVFTASIAPDAPEASWAAPEKFAGWAGLGDAAIWTGAALMADAFRYATTQTEADYQRMEAKTRVLLRNFEVTGVPGYLARYHFLLAPPGTPQTDRLMVRVGTEADLGNVDLELPSVDVEGLPEEYRRGLPDGQGGFVPVKAYWNGDTSIDQYTGPMTAFPVVWPLLRDPDLKSRIAYQMGCYLRRLKRIEIRNLRRRPQLVTEVLAAFGGNGRLKLDADDPDLRQLDTMVWYVHPGLNRRNAAGFDATCPDKVQTEPYRVLDATAESFELDLLNLNVDLDRRNRTQPGQLDHFYIVSLRGGDASHLIHLAALNYYLSGDEQYLRFLEDELIGKLHLDEVAKTMMAFRLPDWCFRFYGDHITFGTHWQLITLLSPGPLRDTMIQVMEQEAWQKALQSHANAKFNVMYAATVPQGSGRQVALQDALAQLRGFVGNPTLANAPRRRYARSPGEVIAALPAGTTVRCPSEEERQACEMGGTLLGFPLEGESITRECDGRAGECRMSDGRCADGLASRGLPVSLRAYADFLWQRSPFDLGEDGGRGELQSPGRDLAEPYWMARYYGFLPEGAGQVLAWVDAREACVP